MASHVISSDAFELSYMQFDSERYTEFYTEKARRFLAKLRNRSTTINHDFDLAHCEEQDQCSFAAGIACLLSPTRHCRERVRFAVRPRLSVDEELGPTSNNLCYVMWEGGGPNVEVQEFPIASKPICDLMPHVVAFINLTPTLHSALQAVHYLSTSIGHVLISLIYEAPLEEAVWISAATSLQEHLLNLHLDSVQEVNLIGRSKGIRLVVGHAFVLEHLVLSNGRVLKYKQVDDGFSNPNSSINRQALEWMSSAIEGEIGTSRSPEHQVDLLEMFCGNGNHTVALAPLFRQVFAVELNGKLVEAATENFAMNGLTNARALKCDSSRFAMQILKQRRYEWKVYGDPVISESSSSKIDKSHGEELDEDTLSNFLTPETVIKYDFQVVIVDPPRAGLDMQTIRAVAQYPYIIYISCNPDRLLDNLVELSSTHKVSRLAIMDHFAYTPHLEVAVFLSKVH